MAKTHDKTVSRVSEPYVSCCPTCFVNMRYSLCFGATKSHPQQAQRNPNSACEVPANPQNSMPRTHEDTARLFTPLPERRTADPPSTGGIQESSGWGCNAFVIHFPQNWRDSLGCTTCLPPTGATCRATANMLYPDYWRGSETGGGTAGLLSCNYKTMGQPTVQPHSFRTTPAMLCRKNCRDSNAIDGMVESLFHQVLASPAEAVSIFSPEYCL